MPQARRKAQDWLRGIVREEKQQARLNRVLDLVQLNLQEQRRARSNLREELPSSKEFGDGPGLGDAAARGEGGLGVEDFGESTEAVACNGLRQRFEETERVGLVLVDAVMREGERTERPAPNGTLVIGGVAIARAAAKVSDVAGFVSSEAAQAEWCKKFGLANVDYGFLLIRRERRARERDRENLVGAERCVVADSGRIDDVVETVAICVPEFCKAGFRGSGQRFVARRRQFHQSRELRHRFERVDPKGVDFDRFSGARSDHPIANFGVHPGELNAGGTAIEK